MSITDIRDYAERVWTGRSTTTSPPAAAGTP